MKYRQIVISVLLIILFASVYTYAVLAQTPSGTLWLSSGVYPNGPAYTVFLDNGVYYAKDAHGWLAYESSDAWSVIQPLIQNGISIFVKAGTYTLNNSLTVAASDVSLFGEPGTIFKNAVNMWNATIFVAPTSHRIVLKDFALDGTLSNSVTNVWSFGIQCQGSDSLIDHVEAYGYGGAAIIGLEHGARNDTVQNCYAHDNVCFGSSAAQNAFNVVNASFDSFLNNFAMGNEGDALDIYGSASDILVEGNTFVSNTGDGVHLEYYTGGGLGRVSDISIIGNTLSDNGLGGNGLYGNTSAAVGGYAGVLVEEAGNILISNNHCGYNGRGIMIANYRSGIGDPGSNFVTVVGNQITNSLFEGIHLNGTWYSTVSNNIVSQNNQTGMLFYNIAYCNVLGNTLYDNGINASNTWDGIDVLGTSSLDVFSNNVVTSLVASNRLKYGIYTASTTQLVTLQDNKVDGSTGRNIEVGNAHQYLYNNQGYNPVGYIGTPVSGGNILADYNGTAVIGNGASYTNWQSAKTIYISGGTVSSVTVDGSVVFTYTNCTVHLMPSDTFAVAWTAAPTITVFGE